MVDAIVRVVRELSSYSTVVCFSRAGALDTAVYSRWCSCCQRYFLMMRLSYARDPETSLYQPPEYSSSQLGRQLNQ
jgi:hypothetical protein